MNQQWTKVKVIRRWAPWCDGTRYARQFSKSRKPWVIFTITHNPQESIGVYGQASYAKTYRKATQMAAKLVAELGAGR